MLAFHEAFADIVALFQHFSYPEVLRDQIAQTRGNLERESLLGQLAQQFGERDGRGGALRDALGEEDDGVWKPHVRRIRRSSSRCASRTTAAPILVAAVFDAFLRIYGERTRRPVPDRHAGHRRAAAKGDIHPDLVDRLADEAASCAARHPADVHPGARLLPAGRHHLRRLSARRRSPPTSNLSPEDDLGYRVAFIESFREWGISPRGIRSMAVEALVWPTGAMTIADTQSWQAAGGSAWAAQHEIRLTPEPEDVQDARETSTEAIRQLFEHSQEDPTAPRQQSRFHRWDLSSDRYQVWKNMDESRQAFWRWLVRGEGQAYCAAFGLVLGEEAPRTVYRRHGRPALEVHSVRTALHRDNSAGAIVTDLVVEATQRRRGYFTEEAQKAADARADPFPEDDDGADDHDFVYRAGGRTLLIDATDNVIRHVIRTPGNVADERELARVRAYLTGEADPDADAFGGVREVRGREPFAMLHRHAED